ncbi:sulfotransferase [Mycoplasmatota bacterium]|nr:sulfotransferase [Mycoplasmatota bacterium]
MKYIYIGGYGRSGSTLIDLIFNDNNIFSMGEFLALSTRIRAGDTCTCGLKFDSCKVWKDILFDGSFDLDRYVIKQKWADSLLCFLTGSKENALLEKQILKRISKFSDVVSDSSKTTFYGVNRPFHLLKNNNVDLRFIHLIRNPKDVMLSNYLGDNKKLEKGISKSKCLTIFRTAVNWNLANLFAYMFGVIYPKRYMKLHYENLVKNPQKYLSVISDFIGEPLSLRDNIIINNINHMVDGNRLRHVSNIKISSNLQEKKYLFRIHFWDMLMTKLIYWKLKR